MRYEKGRKDESRRRIVEAAAARFRGDGIAASGVAAIMSDAGLTNGALYPHFQSKAELVRESVGTALAEQSRQLQETLASGGPEAAIDTYLSAAHRDNPGTGCTLAALLPELARQPPEARSFYAERLSAMVDRIAAALPPQTPNAQGIALAVQATLVGALQLARAVEGTELSDRILAAAADAARALVAPHQ
ncbi:TetR/AcrR family transcriptional regulator [Oleomonas cavernae]|uniref:TetR/AcrR family transcriptional regulator n=1 Tax=Oleomonas cavernae TaxID=2320859 RepID=A0A418WF25_9PROT|nr:TetR/AcrR family transcriptional regulator [Oleomonas cavernae]RJF88616.1 TetR/AcrR family transcriptional regulator [Oleomonas cavernae]